MGKAELLILLKLRLGISSTAKDTLLNHLLDATVKMLDDEKGIFVDMANPVITEFIVNYSTWKYESKGEQSGMPRHIQFALHNLVVHNRKPEVVGPVV